MKILQVSFEKGWHEAIIDDNCGFDKSYAAARILEQELNIVFINKLDGFDTLYWDFKVNGNLLTLHYQVFFGLSVYPTKLKDASDSENKKVLEIGEVLFGKLK